MFWFFGHEACGILAPQPGFDPAPPALEGEVLTTGLPEEVPVDFKSELLFHLRSSKWKCFFMQQN